MQCSNLKNTIGGIVIVNQLNLYGLLEMVYCAINLAETAVEKEAATLLISLNASMHLNELSN